MSFEAHTKLSGEYGKSPFQSSAASVFMDIFFFFLIFSLSQITVTCWWQCFVCSCNIFAGMQKQTELSLFPSICCYPKGTCMGFCPSIVRWDLPHALCVGAADDYALKYIMKGKNSLEMPRQWLDYFTWQRQAGESLNLNQKLLCPASMGRMEQQYINCVNYCLYSIYWNLFL